MAGLRPTPDRVRETLFNWLGQTLHGKYCLDLFSGSGALGFEAASRGAAGVWLVEHNRTAFMALRRNQAQLALPNIALLREDGLKFVQQTALTFDIVFLDPPFQSGLLDRVLPLLGARLNAGGVVYVESGMPLGPGADWLVLKHDRAGAVHYQLLRRAHD